MTAATELAIASTRTPWGTVWMAVDLHEKPVVLASCIGSDIHDVLRRAGLADARLVPDQDAGGIVGIVDDWADGDIDAVLRPAVRQPGGSFYQAAWTAMRQIPGGSVASYADLAAMAGRPRAVRAAGTACASNAVAPFVPCHRVVRTGGALGNYGYGIGVKHALLVHEGALAA